MPAPAPTPIRPHRVDAAAAWRAVERRDPARDGEFVFAVVTTGVYCRPSCPARRPNRDNVRFYRDGAAARDAGFRACRRCRPDEERADPVATARIVLESATEDRLTLAALARQVGMSPSHLQRSFKARFGISPREFQSARRASRFRVALRGGGTVSRATYDAGYGSSSRVYEGSAARLGTTPGRYAKGGAGLVIRFATAGSVLGRFLVGATDRGLAAVLLGGSDRGLEDQLRREFPAAAITRGIDPVLAGLVERVKGEIEGTAPGAELPLELVGTAFQERVWRALRDIPRGATESYRDLARRIGRPTAVRAVAGAVARNRLAVVVPCHRVIREDGGLGGYRWGEATKRRLLAGERG